MSYADEPLDMLLMHELRKKYGPSFILTIYRAHVSDDWVAKWWWFDVGVAHYHTLPKIVTQKEIDVLRVRIALSR